MTEARDVTATFDDPLLPVPRLSRTSSFMDGLDARGAGPTSNKALSGGTAGALDRFGIYLGRAFIR